MRSPYNEISVFVTAYVVPVLCAPLSEQSIKFAVNNYPHLSGLWLADFPAEFDEKLNCEILIGSNFYWQFLSGKCVRGQYGPTALESCLGWILSGPVHDSIETTSGDVNIVQTHVLKIGTESPNQETCLQDQVAKFWELEGIGISKEEASVYETFQDEITFSDGRYEVKLPWKPDHPVLSDNYQLSKRRFEGVFSKLKANTELLNEYNSIIKEQESRGIIERVSLNQEVEVGKVTYLPHHPVIRQEKLTTKVRIVYDASAKEKSGASPNQSLYTGPCLLKTIAEIVVRFRLYPIGICADIEKAFLMISIWPPDRDVLRFLWIDDINSQSPQIIIYRFKRVVFGVSCSPFLLNATLKRHIEQYSNDNPEICQKLTSSLYCDDVSTGSYSEEEALNLYKVSRRIMNEGSFNLRKWLSNSKEVMSRINSDEKGIISTKSKEAQVVEDDQTFAKAKLEANPKAEEEQSKVLGLNWDRETDSFVFKFSHLLENETDKSLTKRSILSLIARIFDPLGLIAPVVTPLKVFLQKLFREKIDWDETLPSHLYNEWLQIANQLHETRTISVPRYYFGRFWERPSEIELIGFCDSSQSAYAAVVYGKISIKGQSSVSLIMSKSRVAPLDKHTIPRLELLAALILARLIKTVRDALIPLCDTRIVRCWTDSITVMYWIKRDEKEYKMFVENRVQEIRKLVQKDLWEHCPGIDNPADIPTRSESLRNLEENSRWFQGPEWLKNDDASWPKHKDIPDPTDDCVKEMKAQNQRNLETTLLIDAAREAKISELISCERFSSYEKLLRVTAFVLRFINNCRSKTKNREELTATEILEAETYWIKDLQTSITEEKFTEWKKQLGTYVDDSGVIRCLGRLRNSNLSFQSKHPALLPRDHYVTELIVKDCHTKVWHNGTNETLQELRSRFWIVKGRQQVKKIIHKCVLCKKIQGMSYGAPQQSQLPELRVNPDHSFSSVGIDFAGPLFINCSSGEAKKTYVALFTCGTSRAVHLELVPDLSTETFLFCFRRFTSRRGIPGIIVTDNAKTFKAFSRELRQIIKSSNVQAYLADKRITWQFNLSKAPWWGGFYERLIKSVKLCLKKCVGKAMLSYDELQTVIVEIEGVLNSRPLTYQYSEGIEEPLTPSHLIIGRRLLQLPTADAKNEEDKNFNEKGNKTRKRSMYISKVLNHCWKRWKSDYLVNLREQHRPKKLQRQTLEIAPGDIVLIQDENLRNRNFWKLGRVLDLIDGKDKVTRGARLLLGNRQTIERPLQKLYPLEIKSEVQLKQDKSKKARDRKVDERPKRTAAVIANMKIIDQFDSEVVDSD